MKIIHTGDIHLVCTPDAGADWSRKKSRDIWRTFEDIIKAAESERAKLLLICGDLFHRQPLLSELNEVNSMLSTIPDIHVVITAGNHDYLIPGSAYYNYKWSDNVHFIKSKQLEKLELNDINTVVYGFSYYSSECTKTTEDFLGHFTNPHDGRTHILMLHGGDEKHLPIEFNRLDIYGFDYIALGHIHKQHIFSDSAIAYCGSPEALDRTEKGAHGYMTVSLKKNLPANIKFVEAARSSYISCRVKITPESTISSLRNKLSGFINTHGLSNIYSIVLTGTRPNNLQFELTDISDLGNIIELKDTTTPDFDIDELCTAHKDDLIDKYIKSIMGADSDVSELSETKRSALYYGVSALLDSSDINGGAQ